MRKTQLPQKADSKKDQNKQEKAPETETNKNSDPKKDTVKTLEYKKELAKPEKPGFQIEQRKNYDLKREVFRSEKPTVTNDQKAKGEAPVDLKRDVKQQAPYNGHKLFDARKDVAKNTKDSFKATEMKKELDRVTEENTDDIRKMPLTAAEMWKNAAKILDSKKAPKKFNFVEQFEKKFLPRSYSKNEYFAGFHQSVIYQSTLRRPPALRDKVNVPDFFPKQSIHIFEGPDVYHKLDIDTLFFVFYFSKDEKQFFSARELKKYSWRFHTKYNTWFQRLEEPRLITEYYEQGVFLFFDYEVTWTNRKKKDFTFEYKHLENIEM